MNIYGHYIPIELLYVFGGIFTVLILCSSIFWILHKRKPSKFLKELIVRTRSWWYMAIGIAIVVLAPPIFGTILIAYVSFVALREMFSITGFREADRNALFAAYFAIPVQYYLAYQMEYYQFLYFIPLLMFIGIPFILVMTGKVEMVGRSMSLIPTVLLLTVYMLSHIVLLYGIEIPNYELSGGALIIYLIILTSFNDVFQFTWGKLLGERKVLPTVSPNKTWEGLIGGIATTAVLSCLIRFLTPFTIGQALFVGLAIGVMGFVGDSVISAIKRDLHLKDTDDLIPGHGGAMDRLDSIVITAPIFYHLLTYFIEQ